MSTKPATLAEDIRNSPVTVQHEIGRLLENNTQLLDDKRRLMEALTEVLGYSRGTSGRIIIEVHNEKPLRALLAELENR